MPSCSIFSLLAQSKILDYINRLKNIRNILPLIQKGQFMSYVYKDCQKDLHFLQCIKKQIIINRRYFLKPASLSMLSKDDWAQGYLARKKIARKIFKCVYLSFHNPNLFSIKKESNLKFSLRNFSLQGVPVPDDWGISS